MAERIVLITGANRGIGFAILRSLARQAPQNTYILGIRSLSSGQEAVEKLNAENVTAAYDVIQLDVNSDDSIRKAVEAVQTRYTRLDCLINNAAWASNPSPDFSDFRTVYNRVFDTNITSVAITTGLFAPLLNQSSDPRVINISSARGSVAMQTASKLPPTASIPYTVSKTALNIATLEQAKLYPDILFQSASPGHCKTAFNGYRGKKDPMDGARIVVELALCERDKYIPGFWELEEGEIRQVPW